MENQTANETRQQAARGRRLIATMLAGILIAAALLGVTLSASSDNTLFSPVAAEAVLEGDDLTALRARSVQIKWDILSPTAGEIRLNLFDDLSLTAEHVRTEQPVTGGFVWIGAVVGEANSTVTLSVKDGALAGSVHRFGREGFTIQPAADAGESGMLPGLYTILELDPGAAEPSGQDFVVPEPPEAFDLPNTAGETCQEDGSVIDLMVVYTPAARDATGGQAAIEALINQRIAEMNTANAISQVNFAWQLVNAAEVAYVESGDLGADLEALQDPADGLMDEVHALRDAHQADLVALLIDEGSDMSCGIAYQMLELDAWFSGYGFGVSALDYPGAPFCSGLTLAHEIGHNMGNSHDQANSTDVSLSPYSFGYQSPNQTFRTLMAYDCPDGCERINQWANPDVWYAGEPTGVDFDTDPVAAADIARSMNDARIQTANFRANCEAPPPTETPVPENTPQPTPTPLNPKLMDNGLYLPVVVE
ncbi:MAG TPA: M12 family metallo-peptidase [Promineifilum sp.]